MKAVCVWKVADDDQLEVGRVYDDCFLWESGGPNYCTPLEVMLGSMENGVQRPWYYSVRQFRVLPEPVPVHYFYRGPEYIYSMADLRYYADSAKNEAADRRQGG